MFDWNDLRYLLAVARAAGTSEAARTLRVNQSTVSRRISALESDLGVALFGRSAKGLVLKPEAKRLVELAEEMEQIAFGIDREFASPNEAPEGIVRVTTVEEIASMLVIPSLPEFRRKWPGIKIELLTTKRILNLARGEADVSLRLGRPEQGDLHARKVGEFGHGVFASPAYLENLPPMAFDNPELLDWMVLDDVPHHLPDFAWFKENLPDVKPILTCTSTKTLIAAVQAGIGVALLPRPSRWLHKDLVLLPIEVRDARTDIWLVVHKDRSKSTIIQAVMDFLTAVINKPLRPGG